MTTVCRYSSDRRTEWNEFLSESKNGLFLFHRDYMEYHAERFVDFSLMVYDGNELIALLPANVEGNVLVSHGGLTFGGFVTGPAMKVPAMLRVFEGVAEYLRTNSLSRLVYKCVPYIYHSMPSEEDRYALFRMGATLVRRDVTSAIYLPSKLRFRGTRRSGVNRALRAGLEVKEVDDLGPFWGVLEANLAQRHHTTPVHSCAEMEYLRAKFPDNIRLFVSCLEDTPLAGVVIYESAHVAHAQYIASSSEGRETGALDIIFSHLINDRYCDKEYFDFGISTEDNGQYLNEGLVRFKEGFGARAVVHDFYELSV